MRRSEELFAEHGYAGTRMSDIAEAAGVTKGLLYWYFANKEALVAEILVDLREQLRAEQRAVTVDFDDPMDRIYVGTVATVKFVLQRWRLFQIDIPPTPDLREVFGTSAMVHASDTADILLDGQRRGLVRDDDPPHALAQGNAGVVNQFCVARATGLLRGSVEEVAHQAARFIVRALAVDATVAAEVAQRHAVAVSPARRR